MAHKELASKADFEAALATTGKYVVIYLYSDEVSPQAEETAKNFQGNTVAYKVDVNKHETAKNYFKISKTPSVVVYRDGKELKRVDGMDANGAKEIQSVLV